MRIYENESQAQVTYRLRSSAEMGVYRINIIFELFLAVLNVGGMLLIRKFYQLNGIGPNDLEFWTSVALQLSVLCLPGLTICLFRMACILRKRENYRFYQVKLASLHNNRWIRVCYFTVVLEDGERTQIVNTRPIFSTHSQLTLLLDRYVGKTAVVGYNEETGQVVFLG